MGSSYLPVQYVYTEVIQEEIAKQTSGKVFYFSEHDSIEVAEGKIVGMEDVAGEGVFIVMDPAHRIRVDRIITLFGKPAAAYDEYDAFANACLDCRGGYDFD